MASHPPAATIYGGVNEPLYSARIDESRFIADGVTYDVLLNRIVEFTIRAALARSVDEGDWEQDEVRRNGIAAIQIFRNGKAVWADSSAFELEMTEARREHIEDRFARSNEADPALYVRLDEDLRARWRAAGYQTPSLAHDMKTIFAELERDAAERAEVARESLVGELLRELSAGPS
jgi:CRISPR/Cas system-associated endoribonuclease Cas2